MNFKLNILHIRKFYSSNIIKYKNITVKCHIFYLKIVNTAKQASI